MFRGWVALELARIDASIATLVGMQHGLVIEGRLRIENPFL